METTPNYIIVNKTALFLKKIDFVKHVYVLLDYHMYWERVGVFHFHLNGISYLNIIFPTRPTFLEWVAVSMIYQTIYKLPDECTIRSFSTEI